MEHNITDYKGFAVPSSTPCQKEQQKNPKSKAQYEILTNLYNYMWDNTWDDALEITITFTDKILTTYTHEYIQKDLFKLIDKNNLNFRIILFKDYSKTGRLHYHGLIKPINKGLEQLDRWRRAVARRYGRLELKTINSREFYLIYMLKIYINQLEITPGHILTNMTNVPYLFVDDYTPDDYYTWTDICTLYEKQQTKLEKQN